MIAIKSMLINIKKKYDFEKIEANKFELTLLFIKMFIMFLLPIFNIGLALVMLFTYEHVQQKVILNLKINNTITEKVN